MSELLTGGENNSPSLAVLPRSPRQKSGYDGGLRDYELSLNTFVQKKFLFFHSMTLPHLCSKQTPKSENSFADFRHFPSPNSLRVLLQLSETVDGGRTCNFLSVSEKGCKSYYCIPLAYRD